MVSAPSQTTCESLECSKGTGQFPPFCSDLNTHTQFKSKSNIVLRDYQEDGVKWMIARERVPFRGGFLCDEMGLGKTIQMLTLVETLRGSTLVVAPKSVVHQWTQEIKRFRLQDIVTVCTYHKIPEPGSYFHRIILDEGHEARNKSTKTHKSLKALEYKKCWIVTGTPVFNSISDFVNLASFIGTTKLEIQQDLEKVRDCIVLRRTKAQITQPTKCIIHNEELEMSEDEKTLYTNIYMKCCQRYRSIIFKHRKNDEEEEDTSKGTIEIMELYLRCRQAMIWPKLIDADVDIHTTRKFERLRELIESHPDEKSIIFAHFHAEMNELVRIFKSTHTVFRIDGSVSEESRVSQISTFQKTQNTKCIFVIQIKAGGQGINLQAASRVYITSPAWNPATELQAVCRAYRIGQTRDVHVTRLIYTCNDQIPSVEESIQVLQNHKTVLTSEVLAEPTIQPPGRKMTAVELKKFFSGQSTANASGDQDSG